MNYYNDAPMYSDAAMQIGGNIGAWDLANGSGAATLDSTGAPTAAANGNFTAAYPSGPYTLSWDGTGSVTVSEPTSAVTKTTTNGVQHNVVTITHTQNLAGSQFVSLSATPPVTNIHILAPSSLQVSGSVFTTDFYSKLAPFSTFRFMDPLMTNGYNWNNTVGNTTKNWSDRTWPTAGSRVKMQGMAYEDIIDLANHTGKDVWINIPVFATDDYVCRIARLFLYGEPGDMSNSACSLTAPSSAPSGAVAINSTSKIYVEYTNERWNWGFSQVGQIYCMANGVPQSSGATCDYNTPTSAIAAAALADRSLPWGTNMWGGGTSPYDYANQLAAVLTKRDNDIFKGVFGSRSSQIKTVINVQSASAIEFDDGLLFLKTAYGSASASIDEFAVAPYAGIDGSSYEDNLAALFADLNDVIAPTNPNNSSNSIYQWIQADLTEANAYGIPLVAYEGGQGLSGSGGTIETTAQSDPRMYTFYQSYYAVWDKLVGRSHLFNHYTLGGGIWGSLNTLEDAGAQKWDALMSLILTPGDVNGDGVVNQADCAIVQANWGKTGMWRSEGDLNHDGVVNSADLAILNAHISGAQCAAP